ASGLLLVNDKEVVFHVSEGAAEHLAVQQNGRPVSIRTFPPGATLENEVGTRVVAGSDLLANDDGTVYFALGRLNANGKILHLQPDPASLSPAFTVKTVHGPANGLFIRSNVDMAHAPDGNLWVVSNGYEYGLHQYDGKRWTEEKLSERFGGVDSQSHLIACTDGSVWVDGHGRLFRYRDGEWKEFTFPDIPITTAARFLLFEAADGHLWISGLMSQVYRYDNTRQTWGSFRGLNFQCEAADGSEWFLGVDDRVVRQRNGRWQVYTPTEGMIDRPLHLFQTSYGEMWASGSDKGVAATAWFDGRRWHRQHYPMVSWSFDPRAFFEAADGSLWLGCGTDFQGKSRFGGGVIHLPAPRSKKDSFVHHQHQFPAQITTSYGIGQSKDGRIWVGGKPLWTYDGRQWSVFDSIPELTDYVDFIEVAPTGDLWLASRYHGIFRYDGRRWKHYTTEDGLSSNNVINLSTAKDGMWATTFGGFCYFDGERWHGDLFPTALTKTTEGGKLVRSQSGKLWFNHSTLSWRRRALKTDRDLAAAGYPDFLVVGYRGDDRGPVTEITTDIEQTAATADLTFFWR
ncbi:MAG: hypothetical protein AAFN92_15465, partial [Bacteroidota bacterium]